ncbi:MAG: tRNA (adenosine(37)-N6)-threonylcarbamoyltransferase complex transferase subunit TsaD [bacterium]|nr:tRNA (adenosine(37)-N6)-threonylcarbamoyltransferase complex transferase subunit TsaD [Mycoplasmatota bacterium]MDD6757225.1 tRNA (adenosine(37)-N6)-threonylcarbamoyltransferase complex transferase subunit TsaD [bacterium]MDY2908535.1 tRNA (adenosine(37)-N6)-threonylcarbamoyltransferase complex transferase subunit TsaD [Candidatus Faecimonas sp.]
MQEKKDMYILGIESSCDETSVSIVKNGTEEIATIISSQIDIHKDFGGVVPEIASRHHVKNITMVLEECLEKANMTMEQIDAIAITYGPGLIGSLLIGLEAAKTLAWLYQKPLIPVHHIAGHIYANSLVRPLKFPLLALVVSGGHTELIEMTDHYKFQKLGGTLDDAIGECYDKVARVMNLEYPGGPKLDKLSKEGNPTYKLPIPLHDDSYNFSFSGLKSAVINLAHNEQQRGEELRQADLAASFQKVAVESVVSKTKKAIEDKNIKYLIVAGGVAANQILRGEIEKLAEEENIEMSVPPMKYCTDNAAMIAAAGYYAYQDGRVADLTLNSTSSAVLE